VSSATDEIVVLLRSLLWNRGLRDDPIMVLGMHRSGTTLLAQILDAAGVYMGSRLSGNHEPRLFQDANRQALDFFGCSWREITALPSSEALALGYAGLLQAMAHRLVEDMDYGFLDRSKPGQEHWGWKDPRNCLTAPLHLRLFRGARALFIFRRPRPVVDSLLLRDRRLAEKNPLTRSAALEAPALDAQHALRLWEIHNCRALDVLPSFSRVSTVCYEDLLEAPQCEIERVLREVGIDSVVPVARLAEMVRPDGGARESPGAGAVLKVAGYSSTLPYAMLYVRARAAGARSTAIGHPS